MFVYLFSCGRVDGRCISSLSLVRRALTGLVVEF